jgi:hypothetical protein
MTVRSFIKRAGVVTGAATALVVLGATSASAHHCYVPMYSLNGPTSANWFVASAELGASFEASYVTACDAAREAGYAALKDAGLPVGIKIFEKMTIAEGSSNPKRADGTGLEDFVEGSTLASQMVATYIAGASTVTC